MVIQTLGLHTRTLVTARQFWTHIQETWVWTKSVYCLGVAKHPQQSMTFSKYRSDVFASHMLLLCRKHICQDSLLYESSRRKPGWRFTAGCTYRWGLLGPAGCPIKICGVAMFDGLVLEISVVECNETLHAIFYGYELIFIPSGVSVDTLSAEDTPLGSIFWWP